MSLPDARGDAAWTDPESPPLFGSKPPVDHGGGVWSVWLDRPKPYLWHFCPKGHPTTQQPRWALTETVSHEMPSTEPLTLSPSVYWPECCGKHGFLTDGVWRDV